jgi:uncharacterized protein (DUF433 family)
VSGQVISLLDRPTYTYPQVDRLLGLTKGTALRWLNGYRRGARSYDPILRVQALDTRWVTWGEFVETRLLANYRDDVDIPIQKMRSAVQALREEIGADYPLARGYLYLQPSGREMLLRAQAVAGLPEQFALQTASRQIQLAPWVDEVVDLADTDDNELLDVRRIAVAAEFRELHWDPRRRGGLPVVGDSNVLASTVASFVNGGEAPDEVATWYHLTPAQVDEAVRYHRIYAPAA